MSKGESGRGSRVFSQCMVCKSTFNRNDVNKHGLGERNGNVCVACQKKLYGN